MEIRYKQASDDSYAISHVYEESWKHTYRGLLPQDFLDELPKGHWCELFDLPDWHTVVMTDGDEIIGSALFCPSRFEEFKDYGEIVAIYLLPDYLHKGYGERLLDFVVQALRKLGYKKVFCYVLEGNERARRFYGKQGFRNSGHKLVTDFAGQSICDLMYEKHFN